MDKKLQELVNRRPNKWGNVTIKEFERDIQTLQDAVKAKEGGRELERRYASLYLKERIRLLENSLGTFHLTPRMQSAMKEELLTLQTDFEILKPVSPKDGVVH